MRFLSPLVAVLVAVIVAACGPAAATPPPTASSAAGRPSVLPQIISSELAVGENRVLMSVLDATGSRPVASPDRTLEVEFTNAAGETVTTPEPEFIWAIEDEVGVYATEATFPTAGPWQATFTTAAPGAPTEQVSFQFDVLEDPSAVAVGERAPSVDTPTVDDVGGDLAKLSTDDDPEPRFYERSVADALAAGDPFVLAFATPKFCATAQCGPTLDRLKPVAEAHPDMTFINVEPYQLEFVDGQLQPVLGPNGALTPVPATTEFGLRVEPYVYVVGADGRVADAFEVIFSEDELNEALEDVG